MTGGECDEILEILFFEDLEVIEPFSFFKWTFSTTTNIKNKFEVDSEFELLRALALNVCCRHWRIRCVFCSVWAVVKKDLVDFCDYSCTFIRFSIGERCRRTNEKSF